MDDLDYFTEYNGTVQYAPPEILEGDLRLLSTKSDIYSLGILIWEIFTERCPFENTKMDLNQLSNRILNDQLNPLTEKSKTGEIIKIPYLQGTPIEIEELIKKCISVDPENRPKVDEIIDKLMEIQEKYNLN